MRGLAARGDDNRSESGYILTLSLDMTLSTHQLIESSDITTCLDVSCVARRQKGVTQLTRRRTRPYTISACPSSNSRALRTKS